MIIKGNSMAQREVGYASGRLLRVLRFLREINK